MNSLDVKTRPKIYERPLKNNIDAGQQDYVNQRGRDL